MTDPRPAPIGEILLEALRVLRRTFWALVRWNVAFVGVALLVSCMSGVVLLPAVAFAGNGGIGGALGVLAMYLVLVLAMMVVLAIHQGATLAIFAADRARRPLSASDAYSEGFAKLGVVGTTMFARMVVDTVAMVVCLGGTVALASLGSWSTSVEAALLVAGYVVGMGGMLAARSFLGISGPVAFFEIGGPVSALQRSVTLLRGHRLSMLGLRVLWLVAALCVYGAAYAPLAATLAALAVAGAGESGAGLLVLVFTPFLYGVVLMLLSFDTLLEAVFYTRLVQKDDGAQIARVFE